MGVARACGRARRTCSAMSCAHMRMADLARKKYVSSTICAREAGMREGTRDEKAVAQGRKFDTDQPWSDNGHERKAGAVLPMQGVYRMVRALHRRAPACDRPTWTATQPLPQHQHQQRQHVVTEQRNANVRLWRRIAAKSSNPEPPDTARHVDVLFADILLQRHVGPVAVLVI